MQSSTQSLTAPGVVGGGTELLGDGSLCFERLYTAFEDPLPLQNEGNLVL